MGCMPPPRDQKVMAAPSPGLAHTHLEEGDVSAVREESRQGLFASTWQRHLVGLAVVTLVGALIPALVQSPRWMTAIIISFYYVMLTTGWNLTMGYTGLFSFAHVAFAAVGAYASALLALRTGLAPGLAMVAGAAVAALGGLVVGAVCLRLRGFYLVLVTWAAAVIVQTLLQTEYRLTGGTGGLVTPPLYQTTSQVPFYYTGLALALVSLGFLILVVDSRVGLYLRAIRDDEEAAGAMGIRTTFWKVAAFSSGALLAGVAGSFYAHYLGIIDPTIASLDEMAKIILMVVVGGAGTIAGPVVGAIGVTLSQELLRGSAADWSMVVFSVIIIVTVRFAREGLLQAAARLLSRPWTREDGRGG